MQICSDPLRTARSVRADNQWCVTVPAAYPTLFPCRSNNVKYDGAEAFASNPSDTDGIQFDQTKIKAPSICTNNQLIRRLQQNIDRYQTSPTKDTRQNHLPSFSSVDKQRASNGNGSERVNRNR